MLLGEMEARKGGMVLLLRILLVDAIPIVYFPVFGRPF